MATVESSQTKTRQRGGGASEAEREEKGLDGRDREREGYRQSIKKQTDREDSDGIKISSGFQCSCHSWIWNN